MITTAWSCHKARAAYCTTVPSTLISYHSYNVVAVLAVHHGMVQAGSGSPSERPGVSILTTVAEEQWVEKQTSITHSPHSGAHTANHHIHIFAQPARLFISANQSKANIDNHIHIAAKPGLKSYDQDIISVSSFVVVIQAANHPSSQVCWQLQCYIWLLTQSQSYLNVSHALIEQKYIKNKNIWNLRKYFVQLIICIFVNFVLFLLNWLSRSLGDIF